MKRNERVLEVLRQMIAVDSETNTEKEIAMEKYLQKQLSHMPGVTGGMIHIPDDAHDRSVVYGLISGSSKDTVIFMNHHDVVGIEPYGSMQSHAFVPDELLQDLLKTEKNEEVLADLRSGEWLVGRGACDMKGGAAAQLAVFEEYAAHPGKVSLLYISLPDEESYSAGMRMAVSILQDLKTSYGLSYRVLVDSEPNDKEKGTLISYTGSVGKLLPVVVVQGKSVHIGNYGQGINPLGVMAHLIADTEGDMSLIDTCGSEMTPPPAWIYLRDRKEHYDVSLPQRVAACANFMMYDKTPDDVMYLLMKAARHAVDETVKKMHSKLTMPVISGAELLKQAMSYPGFDVFYENVKNTSFLALQKGESTYAQETIHLIEKILHFIGMTEPVVVIAFAPPYYPAADSRLLEDVRFDGLMQAVKTVADVQFRHYFNGISDCSYCCVSPDLNEKMLENNLLLWGKSYQFDFSAMAHLQIPFLLLGPWGKDLHERTERVHIASVSEKLPAVLDKIIVYVGETAK